MEDLGIWIDPIDGTNNYIGGRDEIDALKIGKRTGSLFHRVMSIKTHI